MDGNWPVWIRLWVFSDDFWLNRFRQRSHWKGLSPVCVRIWTSRYGFRQNAASQTCCRKWWSENERNQIRFVIWINARISKIDNFQPNTHWLRGELINGRLKRVCFFPQLVYTYSPCKQMVWFPSAISCAHNSCWPMTAFCRILCTPVACSLYARHLFAALSTFEDQYLILVWLHPMPKTLVYPVVATIQRKNKSMSTHMISFDLSSLQISVLLTTIQWS